MTNTASDFSFALPALLTHNPLFVFALSSEAAQEFDDFDPLIAGIGKVNAAYHLTRKIMETRPGLIINLGSAGSNKFDRGEVVCCTRFIQRDMDVRGLGYQKYETPFSGLEPVLQYGLKLDGLPEGTCGTGDNFEMAHRSSEYDVIDMEAYSLAFVAMKEQIPFLCLKYISDGADGTAAEEWLVQVHHAAAAFKKILSKVD
jgi:adenosylhomocysteine nucleosidase